MANTHSANTGARRRASASSGRSQAGATRGGAGRVQAKAQRNHLARVDVDRPGFDQSALRADYAAREAAEGLGAAPELDTQAQGLASVASVIPGQALARAGRGAAQERGSVSMRLPTRDIAKHLELPPEPTTLADGRAQHAEAQA